jgi:hypothetical protein
VDRPSELLGLAVGLCEHRGLGKVGGGDGGERQQSLAHGRACVRVEQGRATLGDHHRVDDHGRVPHVTERLDNRVDRLHGPEHADLHGVDADVLGDLSHLLHDDLRRDRMHRAHADRVLRGDRRDRGHPVDAAGGERLEVRLDAGSPAGIGPGDRKNAWNAHAAET